MTRLSMRSRLLCAALSTVPVTHPAFAQGHNDVIRNLDNTFNPEDARGRHRPSSFRFYLPQVATSAPIGTRDGEPPSIAIFGYPQ